MHEGQLFPSCHILMRLAWLWLWSPHICEARNKTLRENKMLLLFRKQRVGISLDIMTCSLNFWRIRLINENRVSLVEPAESLTSGNFGLFICVCLFVYVLIYVCLFVYQSIKFTKYY